MIITIYLTYHNISKELSKIIIFSVTCFILMPSIRTAKGLPSSMDNAPHQQSFDYLSQVNQTYILGGIQFPIFCTQEKILPALKYLPGSV